VTLYLLPFAHALVCCLVAKLIVRIHRRTKLTLLTLGFSIFFAISTISITASHFINYGRALPFADDSGMVVYKQLESVYFRQVLSHWIFMAVFVAAQGTRSLHLPIRRLVTVFKQPLLWPLALGLFALFAYTRYFAFGPGLELLVTTDLMYLSAEDAVTARTMAKESFYGQGAYLASVAAYIVLPTLFAAYALQSKHTSSSYMLALSLMTCTSLAYALQTRQKAPIVIVFLTYALIHIAAQRHVRVRSTRNLIFTRVLPVTGAGFLLSTCLYVFVFNMGIIDSLYATIVRSMFVPSAMEANYFYVFPELLDYRGVMASFVIRIFYPAGEPGVSIYDVALVATGNQYTANASFLAIGWSGAGYAGVFLVAIVLCLALKTVDQLMRTESTSVRGCVFALSLPPLLTLNSASLLDFFGSGGIVSSLLLLLCTSRDRLVRPHHISQQHQQQQQWR
jgi:hypothetical protein